MKSISKALANVALAAAKKAAGAASQWGQHQAKEPADLKKLLK